MAAHSSVLAWPGKLHGQRAWWGHKESGTTDQLAQHTNPSLPLLLPCSLSIPTFYLDLLTCLPSFSAPSSNSPFVFHQVTLFKPCHSFLQKPPKCPKPRKLSLNPTASTICPQFTLKVILALCLPESTPSQSSVSPCTSSSAGWTQRSKSPPGWTDHFKTWRK